MANKRRGEPPIPPNPESYMTEDQLEALKKLETFGWHLHIIRRPKFEPVQVVLEHSDGQHALLNETGELEHQTPPPMRSEAQTPVAEPEPAEDPWANATDDGALEVKEPAMQIEPTTVSNEPIPTATGSSKRPPKIIV